ncbi:MAG: hypothetical protein P8Y52_09220 [Xanthomonadales bacterium]
MIPNTVKDGEGNYGYNAAKGEYTDMIEAGILDLHATFSGFSGSDQHNPMISAPAASPAMN